VAENVTGLIYPSDLKSFQPIQAEPRSPLLTNPTTIKFHEIIFFFAILSKNAILTPFSHFLYKQITLSYKKQNPLLASAKYTSKASLSQ